MKMVPAKNSELCLNDRFFCFPFKCYEYKITEGVVICSMQLLPALQGKVLPVRNHFMITDHPSVLSFFLDQENSVRHPPGQTFSFCPLLGKVLFIQGSDHVMYTLIRGFDVNLPLYQDEFNTGITHLNNLVHEIQK